MSTASPEMLPCDPDALRAMVLAGLAEKQVLIKERDELAAERDELTAANEKLHHLIAQLRRAHFGRKSERLNEDQLNLALEDLETASAKTEAGEEKKDEELKRTRTKKRRANRGSLPAHLPRIEQVIEPESTVCPCCGKAMHVIGEDRSERLDRVPAQLRVIVTRRPKYGCECEEAVVQAPAPPRLIEGGIPTEALVAGVLVSKYADHLPLYRQAQIFARQGIQLDRSTLAAWVSDHDLKCQTLSIMSSLPIRGRKTGRSSRHCLRHASLTASIRRLGSPMCWRSSSTSGPRSASMSLCPGLTPAQPPCDQSTAYHSRTSTGTSGSCA